MFNTKKYSKACLSTFDIIGAYFVRQYYVELYEISVNMLQQNKVTSITEGYKCAMRAYLSAFTCLGNDKSNISTKKPAGHYYRKIILNLYKYFQEWSGYATITLEDFICKVVSHLMPEEYYNLLNNNKKDCILHHCLTNVLREFTVYIVQHQMTIIIDDRDNKPNFRVLQDEFLRLLIMEREKLWSRFIEEYTGSKNRKEYIPKNLHQRMVNAIKQHVEKECELQNKLNQAFLYMEKLKEQIKIRDNEINDLSKDKKSLLQKINEYQSLLQHFQTPQKTSSSSLRDSSILLHNATELQKMPISSTTTNKRQKTSQTNSSQQFTIPKESRTGRNCEQSRNTKSNKALIEPANSPPQVSPLKSESKTDHNTNEEKKHDVGIEQNYFPDSDEQEIINTNSEEDSEEEEIILIESPSEIMYDIDQDQDDDISIKDFK